MRNTSILANRFAQRGASVGWTNAGIVVAALLAAGLGAAALTGGNAGRSEAAASTEPAEYTAAEKRLERSGNFFSYDIVY
jgi:hypothetical protein